MKSLNDYPETLADMMQTVAACLARLGFPDPETAALVAVDALRERFGGSMVYFPKACATNRLARDETLRREFNGNNQRELARKYGICVATVYDILKKA